MVTMVRKEKNKIQNGVSKYSQICLLVENQDKNMAKEMPGYSGLSPHDVTYNIISFLMQVKCF